MNTESPDVTDPQFLELTLRHDFEEFYRRHLGELKKVVGSWCRDDHQAEDVVSETFLTARAAWERVGRYDTPVRWLMLTARNKTWEAWRRAAADSRRTCRIDDMAREPYVEPILEVEDALVLRESLRRLPERQARVFALKFAGWSVRDIGLELDIAPATVRNHLRLARMRLRDMLDSNRAEAS